MAAAPIARKGNKKSPFLKALARLGKIGRACIAVGISRDAVHDWQRNDPFFARAVSAAKAAYHNADQLSLQVHCDFFLAAIRPLIADEEWPKLSSSVALAIANRIFKTEFNEGAVLNSFPSRKTTAPSLQHINQGMAYPGDAGLRRPF